MKQSRYEFLHALQLEYLVFEIRRTIYTKQKDVDHCTKAMKYKRGKIEDIGRRGGIKTIFNSNEELWRLRSLIHSGSYPNFDVISYKNEEVREEYRRKDFENYYAKGSHIEIQIAPNEWVHGTLVELSVDSKVGVVKKKGTSREEIVSIANIKRTI